MRRTRVRALALTLAALLLHGCGGGNAASTDVTPPVQNLQAITVNSGPTGQFANTMTTSVTVCVPGTASCQTIANVQVDTGSSGLRLLASAVSIALPRVT